MNAPVRRPGRPREIDPAEAAEVLLRVAGNVTAAAERLGCTPQGLRKLIRAEPGLQEALAEAREAICDRAEAGLVSAVEKGEAWAICFTLRAWGRDRGFGPAVQVQVQPPKPQPPPIRGSDILVRLSPEHQAEARPLFEAAEREGRPVDWSQLSTPTLRAVKAAVEAIQAGQAQ